MTIEPADVDVILVGGGLANGLLADRLTAARPAIRLLLLEGGASLGGNHTWSFHGTDLSEATTRWIEPYVAHRWPRQEVRFPARTRVLDTPYASIPSERFHDVLTAKLGTAVRLNTRVAEVASEHVVLVDGTRLTARCVLDGRGPRAEPHLALGYQKFLGLEVETATPHGRAWPVIMDATVDQRDGYRFVYTLPLDERRLLIEDTYYSDTPALDRDDLVDRVHAYARAQAFQITRTVREEHGILPIVLAGDMDAFWAGRDDTPRIGLRAALFHPTTGFSLPDAAALAEHLANAFAGTVVPSSRRVHAIIRAFSLNRWRERGFFRLLNRMLYMAGTPDARVDVLARFYTLSEDLIRRFYRAELTLADKAVLVTGRPPVPFAAALRCIREDRAWEFARANADAS